MLQAHESKLEGELVVLGFEYLGLVNEISRLNMGHSRFESPNPTPLK